MKNVDMEKVIEFLKTPRGKACLFFGFYLIFFIVLMFMFRVDDSSSKNKSNVDNNLPFSLSNIENDNYHFKYTYKIDDKEYVYEGDKNNGVELFEYNKEKYYSSGDDFLSNKQNIWSKVDNPYIIKEFIDISAIKSIVEKASLVSKTEYESGMIVYSYKIATTTLIKLIEKKKIDLDDPVNEITFKTDEDNEVNDIQYDLSSYCKYKKIANKSCSIELEYSNFGKIKEIKQPE